MTKNKNTEIDQLLNSDLTPAQDTLLKRIKKYRLPLWLVDVELKENGVQFSNEGRGQTIVKKENDQYMRRLDVKYWREDEEKLYDNIDYALASALRPILCVRTTTKLVFNDGEVVVFKSEKEDNEPLTQDDLILAHQYNELNIGINELLEYSQKFVGYYQFEDTLDQITYYHKSGIPAAYLNGAYTFDDLSKKKQAHLVSALI